MGLNPFNPFMVLTYNQILINIVPSLKLLVGPFNYFAKKLFAKMPSASSATLSGRTNYVKFNYNKVAIYIRIVFGRTLFDSAPVAIVSAANSRLTEYT